MYKRWLKIILWVFPLIATFILVLTFTLTKGLHAYRPSIYNYESYMSPTIIEKIKKKYNYKEFKEVNEFTQALNAEKAIAGVGSDFQAAQLIIDNKIKKIDFERIYGIGANNWELRKHIYRDAIVKHIEDFDKLIFETLQTTAPQKILSVKNQTYDVDNDGIADHIYEYIIPYYSQDKGIAYNINKTSRPHLDIDNTLIELEGQSEKLSWKEIINILRKNNYNSFGWTNAYYDNLMIGAFYDNWDVPNVFTEKNYKKAIDSFFDFVEKESGHSIKDTKYNYTTGDGLELLNHLIEPKPNRSDAAILYNGDALDAYYSEDNFASVEEGTIRFIRPKNNYILMDCWIIAKALSENDTNDFLDLLRENIYSNNNLNRSWDKDKNYKTLTDKFFSEFKELYNTWDIQEERKKLKDEFNLSDEEINNLIKKFDDCLTYDKFDTDLLELRNSEYHLFDDVFSELFSSSNIGEIINFDYVSYTPTDVNTYEFIKKWYFKDDKIALSMYEQPDPSDTYNVYPYPIINTATRTKITSYYYEKTKS
ncbi:Uncharacterised protein [Metamycoplasma cloacale]|uniref:Uncharacterized protein n=1 Tax=Metamycoplasma cloacale TaxID=92401 RepID=A0A2Z4LL93_9BACT|nr:hypothetical protein [Metamycoplasma cloacale]AWX42500.1 hypothetical protein DK849_00150 [Metamycoplasma cloacale]VEU79154.1 Uncharacterised protein [Metamycoplasma cloacale]